MAENKMAVVAIGGNSLIKDPSRKTVKDQYLAAKETCVHIADMIEQGWEVAIGHGNGPQVGFILRRSDIAVKYAGMHPVPLDACVADSQGAIGYALQQNLNNEFYRRRMNKRVATVITQVLVDKNDPAFANPTKPIGSFYTATEAREHVQNDGWSVVEDAGRGWRRVVPSPRPQKIIEISAIKTMLDSGICAITVGGGGIPVVEDEYEDLFGVAAVIDKDFASSLLAQSIGADLFLISTSVEQVYLNFNQPDQCPIDKMTVSEARAYLEQGHFARGSMEPKIRAIIEYLDAGGKRAIITSPEHITAALGGETGTHVVPDDEG
ncbi:MAG: carbamate kinase [Anaerolineae bacterium]|nr:carbamate kinase [Anaerolineae bacterium]